MVPPAGTLLVSGWASGKVRASRQTPRIDECTPNLTDGDPETNVVDDLDTDTRALQSHPEVIVLDPETPQDSDGRDSDGPLSDTNSDDHDLLLEALLLHDCPDLTDNSEWLLWCRDFAQRSVTNRHHCDDEPAPEIVSMRPAPTTPVHTCPQTLLQSPTGRRLGQLTDTSPIVPSKGPCLLYTSPSPRDRG